MSTCVNDTNHTRLKYLPVALGRQFIAWREKDDPEEAEALTDLLYLDRAVSWDELLKRRRVVVLAEPGAGKTTELEERTRQLRERGEFAFFATLQNIGQKGFEMALIAAAATLAEWRASSNPAWFFLDSVDEAKSAQVSLMDALSAVGVGISGYEGRAHIVISGRHTDWEFRRDVMDLERLLPLPPPDEVLSPIEPDEVLVQYMRSEEPKEARPSEVPLIVVMAPLTREQVETFARAKGVSDSDVFLKAIEKADLWRFARRPLDLQWLVHSWRTNASFGSYQRMLELSLRQRLQESDPKRARRDALDSERAYHALTRIGAALVLQGLRYVLVPDGAVALNEGRTGLPLEAVLPEWSGRDRTYLINRAVFDPVVVGLVRLHQDNQGEVRSYLAARWLKQLIDENCPRPTIHDLLFATTYGIDVVIPSMRQTAAWLALWDSETAREILRRDPQLLIQAGDPASLPLSIREALLRAVVVRIAKGESSGMPDHDHLSRFAQRDIVPLIRELWITCPSAPATRNLLLQLIWLGSLADGADLAEQAAFESPGDPITQLWAGNALLATAGNAVRQKYAQWVLANAQTLSPATVWEALEDLFPREIGVTELLSILRKLDLTGVHSRLDRLAGKLAQRLSDLSSLEQLLAGLLARLDSSEEADDEPNESLITGIETISDRILTLVEPQQTSGIALDGVLKTSLYRRWRKKPNEALYEHIRTSPERRRAAFWHAATTLAAHPDLKGTPLAQFWQFRALGFVPPLEALDLDWLLDDANHRLDAQHRRLAADAVMFLRQAMSLGDGPVERLRAVAGERPEVLAVLTEWLSPRTPSPQERASQQRLARLQQRNSIQQAQNENSWISFAQKIRADPQQLCDIQPPTAKSMDARLYHLWHLLRTIGRNKNRYAFNSLDALVPVIGREALEPLRGAFIRFWRHWAPTLRSARPIGQRNVIANFDCVGLAGVSLEASASPHWPDDLTEGDATRAAGYATLELNGFPVWMTALAAHWPDAVRNVLVGELMAELEAVDPTDIVVLQDIRHAAVELQRLVAPYLFGLLRRRPDLPLAALDHILKVLTNGFEGSAELSQYLIGRIATEADVERRAVCFEYAFQLAPTPTYTALKRLVDKHKSEQNGLMQVILVRICGGVYGENASALQRAPFETLVKLIELAYRTIRVEEDNYHSGGTVYRSNMRDDAEGARSALFRVLVETPGRATFEALLKFRAAKHIGIHAERLTELALQRAAEDSEFSAWSSHEVATFERDHLFVPRNPFDLQRLVRRRLNSMQHDLLNADLTQGRTLARQPKEQDVQLWIGEYLETRRGRSYSVERESRVADDNAPDVRFRAKVSDASVPMEIKVAETWSLVELEDALNKQLVKRYLRDAHNRWGILLLVHQKPHRWRRPKDGPMNINQVLAHLRRLASRIAAGRPDAPQPTVELVDVSAMFVKRIRRPQKPAKTVSRKNSGRASVRTRKGPARAKPKGKSGRDRRTRAHGKT